VATCSPGGAGKWPAHFGPSWFANAEAEIIILPDNDDVGRHHAEGVYNNLVAAGARARIVNLPRLPEHGDAVDYLEAGGDPLAIADMPSSGPSPGGDLPTPDQRVEPEARRNAADILFDLAGEARLFCDPDGKAWAGIGVGGHGETWPVRSRGFRIWLLRRFYDARHATARAEAVKQALDAIDARAQGPETQVVHLRVAEADGALLLDLADAAWRAVEVTPSGWRVLADPPVRFRRTGATRVLPEPLPGGSLGLLRDFLNVDDDGFVLAVAWLLAALRPQGPYPILALNGEQGSAKSTASTILRTILDPSAAPLRSLPRDERDLLVAASHARVVAFDNLSGLADWASDALCRLATGGGLATRKLYSDDEEHVLEVMRPVILNGIGQGVGRPDLLDRSLIVTLPAIPDEARRTEAELWAAFREAHPQILGALLTAVSTGLKNLDAVRLERLPRMADFAKWVTACEPALWAPGTFMKVYDRNRALAVETALDDDPMALAMRAFMATRATWEGSSSDWLNALAEVAGDATARRNDWPKNARSCSVRLRRLAPALKHVGIVLDFTLKRVVRATASPGPEE
jgi:hypothetical protein